MSKNPNLSAKTSGGFLVIPARLASTRLPRKLLLAETGKPLIQHTYEAAGRSRRAAGICVAADHEEIAAAVRGLRRPGPHDQPRRAPAAPTAWPRSPGECPTSRSSSTSRATSRRSSGESIDLAIELLEHDPQCVMATLATPIRTRRRLGRSGLREGGFRSCRPGIYFSRSPIPHARQWDDALLTADPAVFYQHVGLYAYRREFLLRLADMPPHAAGETGKPRAASRAGIGPFDCRRRGRRADLRHRYAGRLSGVCRTHRCGGEIGTACSHSSLTAP